LRAAAVQDLRSRCAELLLARLVLSHPASEDVAMSFHDTRWRVDRNTSEELVTRPDVLVARVAAEQDGVVSLAQLRACRVSSNGVTTRVRNGHLHRVYRGFYAVGHIAVPARGRLRAAVLACGESAVLSHFAAADFWSLVDSEDRPPQVSVVGSAGRCIPGVRVHRRRSLSACDVWTCDGMRVTSPARTLLDIAADLTARGLRRTVRRAQAEGRVNVRQLIDVLAGASGQRGAAALWAAVADGPSPTRSELEDVVLDLIDRATSERPEVNAVLRLDGERPGPSGPTSCGAGFAWSSRPTVLRGTTTPSGRRSWKPTVTGSCASPGSRRSATRSRQLLGSAQRSPPP
jgi:hypothetical protein